MSMYSESPTGPAWGPVGKAQDGGGSIHFRLREMPNLIAFRRHPEAETVESASNDWVRSRLGLVFENAEQQELFIQKRHGLWPGMATPDVDVAWVRLIADVFQYWFLIDDINTYDIYDPAKGIDIPAAKELFTEIRAITAGNGHATSRYGEVCTELLDRAGSRMSDAQRRRLGTYLNTMLTGFAQEIAVRVEGRTPGFDEYMALHEISVGMDWVYLLLECGVGLDLSEHTHAGQLRHLHTTLTRRMIYGNDIFGFRRDYFARDPMNGAICLMNQHGLDLQAAIDTLHDHAQHSETEFVSLGRQLLASSTGEQPGLQRYINGLGLLLAGDLRWHYISPRYNGVGHQWNGMTAGTLQLTEDRTVYLLG